MDEEQGNFKVTDRRLFNADGSPRDLPPEEIAPKAEAAKPAEATTTTPVETAAAAEPERKTKEPAAAEAALSEEEFDERDIEDAHDPASFVNFSMSIASNAASALGMMEHPVTHKREVDLELGKHWIDVLGMLQQRTAGNLSAPEAKILESWLADLRMQYVSLTSSAAAQTSQPFTGRDIIGGK